MRSRLALIVLAALTACPWFPPPPEVETFDPALAEQGRSWSSGRWTTVAGEARFGEDGAPPRLTARCEVHRRTLVLRLERGWPMKDNLPLTIRAGDINVKGTWTASAADTRLRTELHFEGPGFSHLLAARELEVWVSRDPPLVVPLAAPLVAQLHYCLQARSSTVVRERAAPEGLVGSEP
ncbi:MAG: hypothetical protein AAFU79_22325 [Myxococcota bacterium]